jgi:hypothetical protein
MGDASVYGKSSLCFPDEDESLSKKPVRKQGSGQRRIDEELPKHGENYRPPVGARQAAGDCGVKWGGGPEASSRADLQVLSSSAVRTFDISSDSSRIVFDRFNRRFGHTSR